MCAHTAGTMWELSKSLEFSFWGHGTLFQLVMLKTVSAEHFRTLLYWWWYKQQSPGRSLDALRCVVTILRTVWSERGSCVSH